MAVGPRPCWRCGSEWLATHCTHTPYMAGAVVPTEPPLRRPRDSPAGQRSCHQQRTSLTLSTSRISLRQPRQSAAHIMCRQHTAHRICQAPFGGSHASSTTPGMTRTTAHMHGRSRCMPAGALSINSDAAGPPSVRNGGCAFGCSGHVRRSMSLLESMMSAAVEEAKTSPVQMTLRCSICGMSLSDSYRHREAAGNISACVRLEA